MQAQKSLSSISANRDLWIEQYRQELADRDKRSSISAALSKGLEKGRMEGRMEGLIEGKYEVARNLLKLGFSPQQVVDGTELSLSEVESLMEGK